MSNKIDIIVPILNEESNIKPLVERIDKSLKEAQIDYFIIFVDDHSTDKSKQVILQLSKKYPIKYIEKQGKTGKAFSILEGSKLSDSEYIVMIDGDLQYPPESIPQMYYLAKEKNLGVVTANRVKSSISPIRRLISLASRFLIGNVIMGVPCDIQSGLKLFKRDIIRHIEYQEVSPWAFDANLISVAKQIGEGMGCVNIDFAQRKSGKSKISIVHGTYQIITGALKARLGKKKIFKVSDGEFFYKSKRFITHTNLHSDNSAFQTFNFRQKFTTTTTILILAIGLLLYTQTTSIVLIAILSAIYFLDLFFGLFLVMKSLHFPPEIEIDTKHIKNLKDVYLPTYTILCPLYKEGNVLPTFIENISKLDYPKDKLEVLLLLEEDDNDTIQKAKNTTLPEYFKILIVPDSNPKTKPKACNYGLKMATGEYIVIYDAEDRPEPLQLKKAVLAFKQSNQNVFCLQAKLNYFNPNQNLLTRLFTAEYSLWFDVILPGLQSIETTIPLGGTSNHFKTQSLKDINGWDAFNVTEDADLGIRLFKAGYKTAIFDSVTLEEANSNIKNWIRQRSRWIKGYLQTYLVHSRKSYDFLRNAKGHYFIFQLVSGLRITFMLINPLLWGMTIAYFGFYKFIGPQIEALFPPIVFYIAGTSAVFGNFLYLYYYMIGAAKRGQWTIIKYVYLVPFYWLLASISAFVAIYQLFFKPHFWEKTIHGLDLNLTTKEKVGISRFTKLKLGLNLNKDYVSGAFLIFASMVGNVLNFLYNAYLGRKLSLEDFGLISLVGSFIYILSVPTSAISKTITQKSAYLSGKFGGPITQYWKMIRKPFVKLALSISIFWLLISPILTIIFKSDSFLPFIIFTPVIIVTILTAVDWGFLNGNMFFAIVGVASIIEALTKLLASVVLVEIGQSELVYLSIPISMIITFFVCYIAVLKIKVDNTNLEKENLDNFSFKFFWSSIANKITHIAFLSLDLVIAKAFLSPTEAGKYALLSLSGKIVYMIGSMFSGFITPIVSKNEGEGKNPQKPFYKLLSLTFATTFGAFLIFGLFGKYTSPILFGDKVLSIVSFLPLYTFAILMQTIASAIVTYHQAKDKHFFSYLGFTFSMVQIVLMLIFHKNIDNIVISMTIGGGVYLVSMIILHFYYDVIHSLLANFIDFLGIFKFRQPVSNLNPSGLPRILIFNWRDTKHVWSGGAEVYVHEIAKRLVKKGYKVTLFCGNDGKSVRNEKIDGVQIIRRGGFYTVYIWAFLYYIFRLHKYFDVIIDSENGIPFFTPLYSSKKIFLLIHHVHQDLFRIKLRPPFSWIGKFLEKRAMPAVYKNTEVITVSPSSKADILDHKITKKEPHVIYNGVDTNIYKPAKKSVNPMILYLGRLTPQKSLSVFIRSAKIILEKVPKVEIVIAGDGQDRQNLIKLTKKLGLERKIKFLGKVTHEEKLDLYQKTWVFVNPSLIEGWGITTIEANACGTPVVASNVAGLRDAVHNPHSGLLVPYGNVDEFSKSIVKILKNRRMREGMSIDSIEWAKKFDWDKSAKQITELL